MRENSEQFYTNKSDNLEEMNKFLETYCPPKLNQEEIDNLNRFITRSETQSILKKKKKKLPANKSPGPVALLENSTKHTKKNLHKSFSNNSRRLKRREHSLSHSMKPPSL